MPDGCNDYVPNMDLTLDERSSGNIIAISLGVYIFAKYFKFGRSSPSSGYYSNVKGNDCLNAVVVSVATTLLAFAVYFTYRKMMELRAAVRAMRIWNFLFYTFFSIFGVRQLINIYNKSGSTAWILMRQILDSCESC